MLIDATDVNAVPAAIAARFTDNAAFKPHGGFERRLPADVGYREERHSVRLKHAHEAALLMLHCRINRSTLTLAALPRNESWRSRKIAFVHHA